MLSMDQRDVFKRTGLLRLTGAVPATEAQVMADRVWSFLSRRSGVDRNDPASWSATRPTGFQPVSRAGELDGMWSAAVRAAVEELVETSDIRRERPRVLMTFPDARSPWTIPSDGWHFDYVPPQAEPGLRALQVFVVVNEVLSHGGATLVVTGSHRLVEKYVFATGLEPRPRQVRSYLSAIDPWLSELWGGTNSTAGPGDGRDQRLLEGVELEDVSLRVVEATGNAGDVYLMHSDCFHAIAENARPSPRIMATSLVERLPEDRRDEPPRA